jgi:hypothetical protein
VIEKTWFFNRNLAQSRNRANLFHFLVRRVLAATVAEFLEFQPFRRRLAVFGRRIVPLFAITAL